MSHYTAKLVGTHFRGAQAKEIVSQFEVGTEVQLQREPDNPHDAYAIGTYFESIHVGYIEAPIAAWLATELDDLLDQNIPLPPGRVINFDQSGRVTYPILYIELPRETEEEVSTGSVAEISDPTSVPA